MLFGLKDKDVPGMAPPHDAEYNSLNSLYTRAGNLEKSLESLANREPSALLTPEQVRSYNSIVEAARLVAPHSVVLKEDAPLIEEGDQPVAQAIFRTLHLAIVPTLHNALPTDNAGAALPGV